MKRFLSGLLGISMGFFLYVPISFAAEMEGNLTVSAETAILMEVETGTILFEKDADKRLPPASVTKIMTLLLIFDALEEGKITLEEEVSTSEYAASMGGSQVFLEVGEKQTVDTMIKCIAVASANDACVAMAERISGSEELFVQAMNERAKNLGMGNTHFVNCNGLDAEGHETTAKDIARMSQELICTYPQIFKYTQIWMENITHVTEKGSSEFGLANTNKLIRHYEYATGLKTGSTSKAKFCLSATAEKDGIQLIAVVMASPDSKARTRDVIQMLNYGFGRCNSYLDENVLEHAVYVDVEKGKKDNVEGICQEQYRYIDFENANLSEIQKKIKLNKVKAPVKEGDIVGEVKYFLGEKEVGHLPILAKENVLKQTFTDVLLEVLENAVTF